MHEISHAIGRHLERRESRIKKIWDICADGVVNEELKERAWDLPRPCVEGQEYKGKSVEQCYKEKLKEMGEQKEGGSWEPRLGQGEDSDADESGSSEEKGIGSEGILDDHEASEKLLKKYSKEELEEAINKGIRGAVWKYEEARKDGTIRSFADSFGLSGSEPAEVREEVIRTVAVRFNFPALLRKEVLGALEVNQSWERPHIISSSVGKYLPNTNHHKKRVVIFIDVSGSIDSKEASQFISLIREILRTRGDDVEAWYGQADDRVLLFKKLKTGEKVENIARRGGGGTDFRPAFNIVKQKNIRPNLFIYFTDGNGAYPTDSMPYKVIWVVEEGNYKMLSNMLKEEMRKIGKPLIFRESDLRRRE